jgi:hypothetical protein
MQEGENTHKQKRTWYTQQISMMQPTVDTGILQSRMANTQEADSVGMR